MKLLIASKVEPEALEALSQDHDVVLRVGGDERTLMEAIADCDALVFRSGVQITRGVLEAGRRLKVVIRAGSGFDNIDLAPVRERGLRFVRIPGPGAKAVAELSFAMMLALSRQLFWADSQWRAGHWVKGEASGRLLTGKVLGVVGAGNIGSRVGHLGSAWGMEVLGCVEHPSITQEARLAERGISLTDFDSLMSKSDFVSVHVPLQASTRDLIDARALSLLKRDAILVNLSRGGVVDEQALLDALVGNRLAGAALDVHAVEGDGNRSPLADLDNVILTPHIGASTIDSQREIGEIIVRVLEEAAVDPPLLEPGTEDVKVITA